jgi:hypothetical protein
MQIDVIERDDSMEVLPSEETEQEREQIRQQALADSAHDLSVDERYVLRRLVNVVAADPAAAATPAGSLITLSVAEFTASAGLTPKVALRRLTHAGDALFARTVAVRFSDSGTMFCWVESLYKTDEYVGLRFSSFFLDYLRRLDADNGAGALFDFGAAVNAPVTAARGIKIPGDLSVVLVSRLQARAKRPKNLSHANIYKRVEKKLKQTMSREQVLDVMEVVYAKGPLSKAHRHAKCNHRDIRRLYEWIMQNKDEPDFLEF